MSLKESYFFCGIGGSGMLPLALILKAQGAKVAGSDRALDQGRSAAKFDFLRDQGIALFPQDGSGVRSSEEIVVASAAVEESVPDIQAARRLGARILTRADLLAALFNAAATSIGIAGTSGKSTVTGMTGWILSCAGRDPTVMNGAVMKNFVKEGSPFASALVGRGDVFVSEVDESDGSIALYRPRIAVVGNVSLDHKPLEELRPLFADFVGKSQTAVLNLDNAETRNLAAALAPERRITYGIAGGEARLCASKIAPRADGVSFSVTDRLNGGAARVALKLPGRHNVANALAALGAATALDIPLETAAEALADFAGIKRRLERIGTARGITIIDDFAHNPDKIAATLETLHEFPGRLLVLFQPHGFGPLRLMKDALIACFADGLRESDVLLMPAPVYYGGTTDRSVTSSDIVQGVAARGRQAEAFATRDECGERLVALAEPGDRILVMGARDDTLSDFAQGLLARLA